MLQIPGDCRTYLYNAKWFMPSPTPLYTGFIMLSEVNMTIDNKQHWFQYSLEFKQKSVKLVLKKGTASNRPAIIWGYH